MPTCKLPLQTLTDVLGLSDVEFNVTGAKVLEDGSLELQVEDLSKTLQGDDAIVTLNFSQRAVVRTLSTSHPEPTSTPITLWYRMNDKKEWEHNHYSEGHIGGLKGPIPVHPEHVKKWKSGKWGYAFAYLQAGRIPKVVNKGEIVPC